MTLEIPTLKLNNGQFIPALGLGTYKLKHMTEEIVAAAIDAGYRLIDTSPVHNDNEVAVGRAIRDKIRGGVVKREDLFIVSKLWNTHHSEGEVVIACEKSLRYLSIGYIDLYLINWPFGVKTKTKDNFKKQDFYMFDTTTLEDVWKQMESCVTSGLVRNIGVSNFNSQQLQRILDIAVIKPVVNQVECSIRLPQTQLIQFCKERDIAVMGYRPLGAPGRAIELTPEEKRQIVLENHRLTSIGERYGKTVAQVCLRYTVQLGVIPIVKTAELERLKENKNVFDFNLNKEDIKYIQTLHNDFRTMTYDSAKKHHEYPFSTPF